MPRSHLAAAAASAVLVSTPLMPAAARLGLVLARVSPRRWAVLRLTGAAGEAPRAHYTAEVLYGPARLSACEAKLAAEFERAGLGR